jgi:hypothetical protein
MLRLRLRTDSGGAKADGFGRLPLREPLEGSDRIGRSWSSLRGEAARSEAFATRKGPPNAPRVPPRWCAARHGHRFGGARGDPAASAVGSSRLRPVRGRRGASHGWQQRARCRPEGPWRGIEAQEGQGAGWPATVGMRTGPDGGAKPRSRENGKGATAAVTRCGCQRVEPSRGTNVRRGEGRDRLGNESVGSETRRTPGSAAGCNKPASAPEEEAVEVVRNHEDGTCGEGGSLGAEAASDGGGKWTPDRDVDGGARGGEAQRCALPHRTNPTRGRKRRGSASVGSHRRRTERDFPGGSSSSGRERRPWRPPARIFGCRQREQREALERHTGDGEGEGGCRGLPTTLQRVAHEGIKTRVTPNLPASSKTPPTRRELAERREAPCTCPAAQTSAGTSH